MLEEKTRKLRGNLNPLPTTDEPAFPCLQAPSCSSYYPSIPAFLAMNLFMQWQVDQSVNRKLPPLPLPSSCMAAALIAIMESAAGCQQQQETGNCSSSSAPGQGELFLSTENNHSPAGFSPHWHGAKQREVRRQQQSWGLKEAISTLFS